MQANQYRLPVSLFFVQKLGSNLSPEHRRFLVTIYNSKSINLCTKKLGIFQAKQIFGQALCSK